MPRKSPQEKKALSYAKDRPSTYHANDKASRKLIPLRKAQVNRDYRRKINKVLGDTDVITSGNTELLETKAKGIQRKFWKKCPDRSLGEVVSNKLERRESHAGNGKTARKKATEFLRTLQIETEQEEDDGRWIAEAVEMNAVLSYGATKADAIAGCKSLARIIFLERLGAIDRVAIGPDSITYRIK